MIACNNVELLVEIKIHEKKKFGTQIWAKGAKIGL